MKSTILEEEFTIIGLKQIMKKDELYIE